MAAADAGSLEFDDEYDVVVVGYGYAGGITAIEAFDAGAKVLLIDKMKFPGGISVCSYGAMRSAHDAGQAFKYLEATNGGRTPAAVNRALADGMAKIEPYMRKLAEANGAIIAPREKVANYPFEGYDTFYQTLIEEIPNFDPATYYPHVRGAPGGAKVFKTLEDNVAQRRKTDRQSRRLARSAGHRRAAARRHPPGQGVESGRAVLRRVRGQ